MSLTSWPMSVVMNNEGLQEKARYLYGVAAACSDGFVR